jgi:hypothetical protein
VAWLIWAALAAPLLWFLTAAFVVGSTSDALERPGFVVWLVLIAVVSVPLTLRLLVDLFTPSWRAPATGEGPERSSPSSPPSGSSDSWSAGSTPRFMTCADFAVAGASEPEGCAR